MRSLEDKVQSKIAQHQDLHGSQRKFLEAPGPLPGPGRDGALLGTSEEGEGPRPLSADDIRDLSPSALQWQELRGLEEKVDTLSRAAEELFRERNSLRDQLRAAAREREVRCRVPDFPTFFLSDLMLSFSLVFLEGLGRAAKCEAQKTL